MDKARNVGIIGAGSWGTTLAVLAAENGHKVLLWSRGQDTILSINQDHQNPRYWPDLALPGGIEATDDLKLVAERCPTVIIAVPSHTVREVANQLGEHLKGDHVLVHSVKGLETQSLCLTSDILRQETCARKIGALSGPNLAAEVMRGDPAATVIGSRFDEVATDIQEIFVSARMRVYGNHDLAGVEIGGAVKNIIAISAGLVNGLGFGDNTKAMLLTRGLAEMKRLGVAMGAQAATFSGLSGFGDLVATCASPFSRNQRVGFGLAQGKKLDAVLQEVGTVAEGVKTTRAVHALAAKLKVEMPITNGMHAILYEGVQPRAVIEKLMTRKAKFEEF